MDCHYEVTAAQRTERRLRRLEAKKQLKIIMNDFKKGQNKEVSEANIKVNSIYLSIGCYVLLLLLLLPLHFRSVTKLQLCST